MSPQSHNLAEVFAVLTPQLSVEPIDVSPSVFDELGSRFTGFKNHVLVSCFEFAADWPTWERHPAGDEIVVLLSGKVTLLLRTAKGDTRIELSQMGSFVIVPRDTWHTARAAEPTRMLFVTPGEGTENRADL